MELYFINKDYPDKFIPISIRPGIDIYTLKKMLLRYFSEFGSEITDFRLVDNEIAGDDDTLQDNYFDKKYDNYDAYALFRNMKERTIYIRPVRQQLNITVVTEEKETSISLPLSYENTCSRMIYKIKEKINIQNDQPFTILTKNDLQLISRDSDMNTYSDTGLIILFFPINVVFINVENKKIVNQMLKFNKPIKYYFEKGLSERLNITTTNIKIKIKNGSFIDINVPVHTILKKQKKEPVVFEIYQEEEESSDEKNFTDDFIENIRADDKDTKSDETAKLQKKIHKFEEILSMSSSKTDNSFTIINDEEESEFHKDLVKIGEGTASITYKLTDTRTKTPMCKKVIKYKNDQTAFSDTKNAMKEYEVMHSINHPCICKAIGINISEEIKIINEENEEEEATTIAIFFEYVDYKLSDILKKEINNTSKTRIVLDIVHAMNFLHKKGMMHRDLKVDNIMINAFFETKLVDFGLVKISEIGIDGFSYVSDSLTRGIGTFAFMSPEMAKEEEYNNKTDVYSFGVILHFIFTGDLPKQSLKDKINGKKIDLPKPSKSISKVCIKLIDRCMSYSPSKRPSFERILNFMRKNSYELASDVNATILSRRDKELDFIENYK